MTHRPTETQIEYARALVEAHRIHYGISKNEQAQRRLVYAVLAAAAGFGGVPQEFEHVPVPTDWNTNPKVVSEDVSDLEARIVELEGELTDRSDEVVALNQRIEELDGIIERTMAVDAEDADEDEEGTLTHSDFDGMNKEALVKAYGESHGLTMDMTRDEMHKTLFT